MAGWGDDPELERLRELVDSGWKVTDISEDSGGGGAADTVTVTKDGETVSVTSDHLAFHRYVEYLREEQSS